MKYPGMYRLFLPILLVPATFGQDLGAVVNPPVLLRATDNRAKITVHHTLTDKVSRTDLSLGALTNDQKPDRNIIPTVEPEDFNAAEKELTFTVKGLIPFGISTVPLLVKGQMNQTIRFHKPGLAIKPTRDAGFAVRQGENLFVVIDNTTEFDYNQVRARFRFQDVDVCKALADKSSVTSAGSDDCEDPQKWVSFAVPKYSPVTLRVPPADGWFLDATTRLSRSAKRKGVLSLRYVGEEKDKDGKTVAGPVYEPPPPPPERAPYAACVVLTLSVILLLSVVVFGNRPVHVTEFSRRFSQGTHLEHKRSVDVLIGVSSNGTVHQRMGREPEMPARVALIDRSDRESGSPDSYPLAD